MALAPGTLVGRYEIRRPLGEGGMGEVYLAWDRELERDVAIKVMHAEQNESPDRARRFVQEAKAASGLNHPNVATIYDFGTSGDLRFIAMEVVQGETLRERLVRGPMTIEDVLSVGTQIAGALAAAHAAGVIHRDVKPENVIVRPDGYAKVLDFGLAKLSQVRSQDAATLMKTQTGLVMGTLRYMAPEQLGGSNVTAAADVFSLGVVLYEMVCGQRPFEGRTASEIATGILTREPKPLAQVRAGTPPRLASIVEKALQKDPLQRYATAATMAEDLKAISRESQAVSLPTPAAAGWSARPRRGYYALGAVLLIALVSAGLWTMWRSRRIARAGAAIASAEMLLDRKQYAEAFDLVSHAAEVLPLDPRVQTLIARTSASVTIESDPPGATVFLERYPGTGGRARAGTTPLTIPRLARADYIVTLEKEGFGPALSPLALAPAFVRNWEIPGQVTSVKAKLLPKERVPPEMVLVAGGAYRLSGWSRPSDRQVELRDFLIDRHEVSNTEFEKFVRDGGYRRRELWKAPFVDEGRTLSFEEAMGRFRDSTGLPGPRGWSGGAPPAGRENHPVTGVTWYEAAAYAEWRGKSLPSIYQWEKAARYPVRGAVGSAMPWGLVAEGVEVTERANFRGKGTMPVDSLPFGLAPSGALHMAGNVAEWCVNPKGSLYAVRGGGWNDAVYIFGRTGSFPPFYASDTLGFRCVRPVGEPGETGGFALPAETEIPEYQAVGDGEYETIRRRYDYEKTPLNARVVAVEETADWRRERIVYSVEGHEVPAYLYLPKGYRRPLQVIFFAPAGDVASGARALPASIESSLGAYIRGGRAVFSVVMEGFMERPRSAATWALESGTAEYVDYVVEQVTEQRRALDYLESRGDLDASRVAFIGPSAGSWAGLILTAVEPRFRSVMFIGTNLSPQERGEAPAASRINFAPRIAAPKLMLHGRYDESAPLETAALPLFRLLREPKRLEVFEGSHVPPADVVIPLTTRWLDETLGRVEG